MVGEQEIFDVTCGKFRLWASLGHAEGSVVIIIIIINLLFFLNNRLCQAPLEGSEKM